MLPSSQPDTSSSSTPAALTITGAQWALEGPVTFETVAALEEMLDRSSATPEQVSLDRVTDVDSSAVALLVAIKRRHRDVKFAAVPAPLSTLTQLYGVEDLLM